MASFSGEAWEGLMDKIQQSQHSAEIPDQDWDQAFLRLQRLLERKVRTFWHRKYFQKYMDNNIVPWGLRVQIFPNLKKIDEPLKTSWENNLQSCSFGMMSLLCTQYEAELKSLDDSVSQWYEDYTLITTST